MSISVTISKTDQGTFTVAQGDAMQDASQVPAAPVDPNAPPAAPAAVPTPDADADTDGTQGQPAPDLISALKMAAAILSADKTPSAYQGGFDAGMAKNNPGSLQAQQGGQ